MSDRAGTPNISLQRTAPCGLAAELGSLGGRAMRQIAILVMTLACASTCLAAKPSASALVPGMYQNFEYLEDAGDVVGMGVFIVWSSDGLRSSFHALVQTAEGMPGTPVLVTLVVKGSDIEFSLPGDDGPAMVFKGTVSKKGLTGTFGDEKVVLKRVHRGFGW